MELEEAARLRESAEKALHILDRVAGSYDQCYQDFQDRDNERSETGRYVSKEMLMEETERAVGAAAEAKSIKRRLEGAAAELPDSTAAKRHVDGEVVDPSRLQDDLSDLAEQYGDSLESIWATGYRMKEETGIDFDPIEARLRQWRRQQDEMFRLETGEQVEDRDSGYENLEFVL